jgi:hypothetical protein
MSGDTQIAHSLPTKERNQEVQEQNISLLQIPILQQPLSKAPMLTIKTV